jgi:hypothetical protein
MDYSFNRETRYTITSRGKSFDAKYVTSVLRLVNTATGKQHEPMHKFMIQMDGTSKTMSIFNSDISGGFYSIEEFKHV